MSASMAARSSADRRPICTSPSRSWPRSKPSGKRFPEAEVDQHERIGTIRSRAGCWGRRRRGRRGEGFGQLLDPGGHARRARRACGRAGQPPKAPASSGCAHSVVIVEHRHDLVLEAAVQVVADGPLVVVDLGQRRDMRAAGEPAEEVGRALEPVARPMASDRSASLRARWRWRARRCRSTASARGIVRPSGSRSARSDR